MLRTSRLLTVLVLASVLVGGLGSARGQDRGPSHSVGMLSLDDVSPDVQEAARRAMRGPDETGKNGPFAKVGHELALLYYLYEDRGAAGVQGLRRESESPRRSITASRGEGRRWVQRERPGRIRSPISPDGRTVLVTAIAVDGAEALQSDLRGMGLEGGATAGNVVSGRLPISAIEEVADLSSLQGMVPSYARTHVGLVESEADTAHRALEARIDFGVDGSGQKICALSDSYNQSLTAATSAEDDIQSGDLPGEDNPEGRTTPIDVLDDTQSGSDEGRAMLQLIHDIAPGAELGFHTAFGGLADFAQGIRELEGAGCTVIVDDVGFFAEPFYQDGPVSNAVNDVVENGAAYFSSAGNDGQNSYEAPFRDSGEPGVLADTSVAHDFDPSTSTDTRQQITINTGGSFNVATLQWTDPSAIVDGSEGADTDLDVALVNDTLGVVAQSAQDSDTVGTGNGVPFERLTFENDGSIDADNDGVADTTFHVVIEKAAGPDPDEVKYIYSGQNFDVDEFDTLGPTVFGHPMAEGAMATAAAPFFNTARFNANLDSSAVLEFFSSLGGIQIRFDQNGDELSSFESREKPDVTGTDRIDNTFFGTDIPDDAIGGLDSDPHPNFSGTSAAAPNVAAIASLVREADPSLTPTAVYDRLESTAVDVRARQTLEDGQLSSEPVGEGVDPWSGHGFVRADRAIPSDGSNNAPTASADDAEVDEDTVVTVAAPGVLENDTDPDGDALSVVVVDGDEGSVGIQKTLSSGALVTLNEDGSFTYDPNGAIDPSASESDTDSFTYTITDGNGESMQSTATVTVNGVNNPPSVTTNEVLVVGQGERDIIGTDKLSVSDDQTGPANLDFTVDTEPSQGTLLVGGTQTSTFTQQDLVDERVEYDHTASTIDRDQFDFTVSDSLGKTTSGTFEIAVSRDVAVSTSRSFPEQADSTNYQLVALPGLVDVDVSETLTGEPGPNWRAFRELGASAVGGQAGLEEYDGSAAFDFQPGRAFWVLAQEDWSFEDTVEVIETSVPLQEGWNAVSNPLQRALPWSDVQTANGLTEQDLWRWNAGWERADTLAAATTGEGFYVFNDDPDRDSLDLTVDASTSLAGRMTDGENATPRTVQLTAVTDGKRSAPVTVGLGEEASTSRAPPAHFGRGPVSLRLQDSNSDGPYVRQIAPASGQETERFELVLRGDPDAAATIEVSGPSAQAENSSLGVVLVEEDGREHDLQDATALTVTTGDDGVARLDLHVGAQEQIQDLATPDETALRGNYPNPFSAQTTVELALAEQADVKLQVYNVLGQRVATIENGVMQAGTHEIPWTAGSLPSGNYFLRLDADGKTDTRQVTIIR